MSVLVHCLWIGFLAHAGVSEAKPKIGFVTQADYDLEDSYRHENHVLLYQNGDESSGSFILSEETIYGPFPKSEPIVDFPIPFAKNYFVTLKSGSLGLRLPKLPTDIFLIAVPLLFLTWYIWRKCRARAFFEQR